MPDRSILVSAGEGSASDSRIICQAILSLWAYSATCGAIAVGLGEIAARLYGPDLSATWLRAGTTGAVVLAAGLRAERVLRYVVRHLGLPTADS